MATWTRVGVVELEIQEHGDEFYVRNKRGVFKTFCFFDCNAIFLFLIDSQDLFVYLYIVAGYYSFFLVICPTYFLLVYFLSLNSVYYFFQLRVCFAQFYLSIYSSEIFVSPNAFMIIFIWVLKNLFEVYFGVSTYIF